jgi:hypothetical protein
VPSVYPEPRRVLLSPWPLCQIFFFVPVDLDERLNSKRRLGHVSDALYNAPVNPPSALHLGKLRSVALCLPLCLAASAGYFYLYGQDKTGFPDGYDAVQAAPNSHKVVFENEFVRVLEVTIPPQGQTEPMHHHRWPSFFLDWDTGGGSSHIRYHAGDGTVRDIPSKDGPSHPGIWSIHWMKPEAMHAIEVVNTPPSAASIPGQPPLLRVEIKCHP